GRRRFRRIGFFAGETSKGASAIAFGGLQLVKGRDRSIDIMWRRAAADAVVGSAIGKFIEVFDAPGLDIRQGFWAAANVGVTGIEAHGPLHVVRAGAADGADIIRSGILEECQEARNPAFSDGLEYHAGL